MKVGYMCVQWWNDHTTLEDLGMVLIQTYAMLILSTLIGEMVLTTKQIA